jgi:nucleoside-diphosphate-sugar epimerase
MEEIVTLLCELAGVEVQIVVDPEKVRPIETLRLYGSSSKLRALGWEPRIPFEQTLGDILDWWLTALAGNQA